ncbi:MAG: Gfo/Idh/MocA family oxidoreductase [Deinococcales bacterium]
MHEGVLGDLVQIRIVVHSFSRRWDWQTLRSLNGGILNNHGAHYLDWLLLHFQDEEPELFCHLQNTKLYAGDADSHAKVILRPKDGPLIDVELSHHQAFSQATWQIMGTQGSLQGDVHKLEWRFIDLAHLPPLVLDLKPTADRSYNRESLPWQSHELSFEQENNGDMVLLYQDLYKTLNEGAELTIKPETVRRQIRIFERCHEQF